jgi:hypothetical protein
MSKEINLYVRFQAEATFSIDEDVVKDYADKHGYDWGDKDEREEAIVCWVNDKASPYIYYSDYSRHKGHVALDKSIKCVSYEIPGESILAVKEEA